MAVLGKTLLPIEDDAVPETIRCWGATPAEMNRMGLAADFQIEIIEFFINNGTQG